VTPETARLATWSIAAAAAAGVLVRPFKSSEAVWAVGGAILLVVLGLLPFADAVSAAGKGTDVYLFLAGMMLLSEAARREGLFDAVAALAVNHARGSPRRLLLLVYAAGVVITVFLSNDATAVVLTPAVLAAARRARTDPLPHLLACAFVANAASFVLPISNPANLVLYAGHTPPLGRWLASFALPSLLAVLATFAALRWRERARLQGACASAVEQPAISRSAWTVVAALGVTVVALLAASALGRPLGLPTAVLGVATAALISISKRASPMPLVRGVSWAILPLVAGLFVLVEGLNRTGAIAALAIALRTSAPLHPNASAGAAGIVIALACNLVNNLPAGVIASAAAAQAHAPGKLTDALLIGVDLGPNLSVTGSLATILWLAAIRRDGEEIGFGRFFRAGLIVMPPALMLALGARLLAK
jgi:arsenical pump membrane protein